MIGDLVPGLAALEGDPMEVLRTSPIVRLLPNRPKWGDVASLGLAEVRNTPGMGDRRVDELLRRFRITINDVRVNEELNRFDSEEFWSGNALAEMRVGDVYPDMHSLSGNPREFITDAGRSIKRLIGPDATWSDVADLELRLILNTPNVGPVRLQKNLAALGVAMENARSASGESVISEMVRVGAAARSEARRQLRESQPVEEVCEELLSTFTDREFVILERILTIEGTPPTLQVIGDEIGLTRERVRQVESRVVDVLTRLARSDEFDVIAARCQEIHQHVGPLRPLRDLGHSVIPDHSSLVGRLLWYIAGPYRIEKGWVRLAGMEDPSKILRSATESLAVDGSAPLSAVRYSLESMGIDGSLLERMAEFDGGIRIRGDRVLDWRMSLHDKAVAMLAMEGRPLTEGELVELVQPNSARSMMNQISTDERITRIGPKRFALTAWQMKPYQNIATTMSERLADGPCDIAELARELAEKWGIAPNSVKIMASTHAAFVKEGPRVRLRRPDEPYVVRTSLENSAGCELDDAGRWRLRLEVDKDVLRGSGRQIPEAFAAHLGLEPLGSLRLESDLGATGLKWGQAPQIGSLRSIVETLAGRLGDTLIMTALGEGRVSWTVERAATWQH